MGWASFKNGILLAAASGKFDVLVTTDQRLSYEHNVSTFAIAVVVLVGRAFTALPICSCGPSRAPIALGIARPCGRITTEPERVISFQRVLPNPNPFELQTRRILDCGSKGSTASLLPLWITEAERR